MRALEPGCFKKGDNMKDRELQEQKFRAQLDEWKAEIEKLKAKAMKTSSDAGLRMNRQIGALEAKVADAERRFTELSRASDDAWGEIKDGVAEAWGTLKTAFNDAVSKYRA